MIMASRIVYGMAEQGIVARVFGRVLPGRRTPIVAILFTTLISVILITTGDLESLADTTVLLLLSVFTIVNIAVLVLRRQPVEHEHFQAPSVFPVLGAIVSVALIVDTALDDLAVFARAAILLVIGVVLWFVNRVLAGPPEDVQAEGLRG
jgi:amino acid transporter